MQDRGGGWGGEQAELGGGGGEWEDAMRGQEKEEEEAPCSDEGAEKGEGAVRGWRWQGRCDQ